jgi:two-component system chemotaxis response regulator CheY
MKALIVDDSRAVRTLMKRMLGEMGFEVSEAGDGRQALDLLQEIGPVDLALVDWNMPEMDGLEFVKALRAERGFSDVTVMMVSAESDMGNIARALMVGADEYAIKPLTREMLEDKLQLLGVAS